jgi:hypothetical protein
MHHINVTDGKIRTVLKNKTIKYRELIFCSVMAVPGFMCGSQNGAMNTADRRMKETAKMQFSRHVSGHNLKVRLGSKYKHFISLRYLQYE